VLEYDDVMNEQRRIVYKYRDEVLEGRDMAASARAQISDVIGRMVDEYAAGDYAEEWDLDGLFSALEDIWPVELTAEQVLAQSWSKEEVSEALTKDALRLYDRREEELGSELMRIVERYILLQTIDQRWREHLYDMDYLREGIHLRGFAQIDPLVAYKNEAFTLFTDLMNTIWSDFARMIFHVEVEVQAAEPPPAPAPSPSSATAGGRVSYSGGAGSPQPSALASAAAGAGLAQGGAMTPDGLTAEEAPTGAAVVEQRRVDEHETIGRNDPCWCGSGKKFKKCHGA